MVVDRLILHFHTGLTHYVWLWLSWTIFTLHALLYHSLCVYSPALFLCAAGTFCLPLPVRVCLRLHIPLVGLYSALLAPKAIMYLSCLVNMLL